MATILNVTNAPAQIDRIAVPGQHVHQARQYLDDFVVGRHAHHEFEPVSAFLLKAAGVAVVRDLIDPYRLPDPPRLGDDLANLRALDNILSDQKDGPINPG